VQPLTDFPERFEQTATLFLDAPMSAGRPPHPTPLQVTSGRQHGRIVVLHLAGVESATEAEKLRGATLSIPAAELPPLPADQYYLHDLVGLRVQHVDGRPLGVIADVLTGAGNDLFVVRDERSGAETLLPAVKAFVKAVDVPGGVVLVEPIPGLFDDQAEVADGPDQPVSPADL
jgi:16S rRNA processing protein RimM